jgi:rhamnosyltransferase
MADKFLKIAAYITSYEDQPALENCIQSILKQSYPVDKVFIVDNSKIKVNIVFPNSQKIIVNHHPENIGISQGLSLGIQWAIDRQYDFLWAFDQDSEALPKTLEHLIISYLFLDQQNISVGILSPKTIDLKSRAEIYGLNFNGYRFYHSPNQKSPFSDKNIYECDVTITSGSLINLRVAQHIDLPDPRLFIDAVDFDYCMRFREKGYKIFVDRNAVLHHHFGTYLYNRSILTSKNRPVYSYSELRYYYMIRNHTWLELRLSKTFYFKIACIIHRFVKFSKACIKILFYESPSKSIKIYACIRGLLDGFTNSLEKRWIYKVLFR